MKGVFDRMRNTKGYAMLLTVSTILASCALLAWEPRALRNIAPGLRAVERGALWTAILCTIIAG